MSDDLIPDPAMWDCKLLPSHYVNNECFARQFNRACDSWSTKASKPELHTFSQRHNIEQADMGSIRNSREGDKEAVELNPHCLVK